MAAPLTMRSPILNSNSTNISPSNSTQPMRASAGARRSSSPSLAARTASNAQQNFTSRLPLISGATDRQDQERSHILNENNGMITDRTLDDDTRRTSTPTTTTLPGIKDLFPGKSLNVHNFYILLCSRFLCINMSASQTFWHSLHLAFYQGQ